MCTLHVDACVNVHACAHVRHDHVSMRIHVWTGIGVKTAIEDGDNTYRGMRARGEGAGAMREPA